MRSLILIALLLPLMSGCSAMRNFICGEPEERIIYKDRIVEVEKPVPVQCPVPDDLPELQLPINNIDESYRGKPEKVGGAYVKSIKALQDRVDEQKILLDVYRNQNGEDQVR